MKIRSLALALAFTFALTTVAEAKKKPPVYRTASSRKAHKTSVRKYKPGKYKNKTAKSTVKRRKHAA